MKLSINRGGKEIRLFDAYKALIICRNSWVGSTEALKVAESAVKNTVSNLGRDIHHKADDGLLSAMADKEWLSMWAESIRSLLCNGEYEYAAKDFEVFGIEA